MMKSKELTHRLFIMVAMAVILVVATLAWFVNSTNPATDGLILSSAPLKVSATLQEVTINGSTETLVGTPTDFNEDTSPVVQLIGMVPGERKTFKIILTNGGETANVSLNMTDISLGKYNQTTGGVVTEKTSELDKVMLYSLASALPITDPTQTIFDQRVGKSEIQGVSVDIQGGANAVCYAVFLYKPDVADFKDGTLSLRFGISATLK